MHPSKWARNGDDRSLSGVVKTAGLLGGVISTPQWLEKHCTLKSKSWMFVLQLLMNWHMDMLTDLVAITTIMSLRLRRAMTAVMMTAAEARYTERLKGRIVP